MSVLPKLESGLMSFMNENRFARKLFAPTSAAAIAGIATFSNLTKDGVNCYYYVTQSLKNKKIPEDKRKFVAGLDLSNGLLNVITQAVAGSVIIPCTNKLFENHLAKKYFGPEAVQKYAKAAGKPVELMEKTVAAWRGVAKTGLTVIAALVATQIVCKRIIVPLIATPMASYFRKKFEHAEKNKKNEQLMPQQDVISFESKPEIAAVTEQKKIPKCFDSFMK